MIIECDVLCVMRDDLGLSNEEEEIWLPIAIDMKSIIAIKSNGEGTEFAGSNRAVMYYGQDYFVTNLSYEDGVIMFKKSIE